MFATGELGDQAPDMQFDRAFSIAASGFDATWQGTMRLLLDSPLFSLEDFSQVSAIQVNKVWAKLSR